MRRFFLWAAVAMLLGAGCTAPEGMNCGTDKECLKNAFQRCEKAYGTWEGNNGSIGVAILGNENEECAVFVQVNEADLDISQKNMTCYLSPPGEEFSIASGCGGELKDYFY